MDDTTIIDLYWARSEQALHETELKYGAYCRAIARNILKNPEDTEESILSAFLGRITRNLAFDRWKAARAEKRGGGELPLALDELDACIAAKGGVEAEFDGKELARAIDAFLRTLPERECSLFLRRYWFVDSVRDIASRYSMNENNVKSILFRTREKLRKYLEEEGITV